MGDNQSAIPGKREQSCPLRRAVLLLAMLALVAMLLAACGTPQPTEPPTVVAEVTAPTEVPATATRPPDTATLAASDTPLATSTLAPTHTALPPTPTATLVPTQTPRPTASPVPPTETALPPTATQTRPPRTPAPPTATAPPPPRFAWRGQMAGTFPNCSLTRLMGLTLDRNGGVAGDIWVHFWADGWDGAWTRSSWSVNEGYEGLDDSSNWDGVLDIYPKAGTWHVCVVPAEGSWECRSETVTAQTVSEPCAPDSGGVQIVRIVFQQN